jgi:hypothetical protein
MAIFPLVGFMALVIIAGSALASCAGGGGKVGEYWLKPVALSAHLARFDRRAQRPRSVDHVA